jgi:hypothetical protein
MIMTLKVHNLWILYAPAILVIIIIYPIVLGCIAHVVLKCVMR